MVFQEAINQVVVLVLRRSYNTSQRYGYLDPRIKCGQAVDKIKEGLC